MTGSGTIGHLVRGAVLVARQEFRIRLRTGRWRWLLLAWVITLTAFTGLVDAALRVSGVYGPRGVPLFGILMLFVLGLVLVISPALTAQSVNGDRERGTLATLQITRLAPAQIALGKFAAAWAVGLVALALTLPFVCWAMLGGGLSAPRVLGVLGVDALLMGVVCALAQALSALVARSITSALLSYLVVFALSVGTLIAFGLASTLVADEQRRVEGDYEYTSTVQRTDLTWWLLAPNPFVVLADSAPTLPPRITDRGARQVVSPDDPLSGLSETVRNFRRAPDYGLTTDDASVDGPPVWPYGLAFDLALGAGALWVTIRRLRTPSRRLARGVRVG
jgi:ABC-type transport system involved in multi-copper enzyme maturation permease subunit